MIEHLDTDWKDDDSLPVQVARAQIAALRTPSDPMGRYDAKWQLIRNLYHAGYNAEQVREVFRLIDWMMHLRVDLQERFKKELLEYEEAMSMPYVSSIERLSREEGFAKGRAKGKAEGGAGVLLGLLSKVCGELPEPVQRRVRKLPYESLEALGEDLLDFDSLNDLNEWLDSCQDDNSS